MNEAAHIAYPFTLSAAKIAEVLPHRGEILFANSLTVNSYRDFQGLAIWPESLKALQGHFPGQPIVPGVYLVEALAQLAGAGLLTGDPYTMSLDGNYAGMLASIRKTTFKHPVFPNQAVMFDIHCRQMGPLAVQVTGTAQVNNILAAELDILLVYATAAQRQELIDRSSAPPA